MAPHKKIVNLWMNFYRDDKRAEMRKKDKLRMQAYRARKKAEAAAAQDGHSATKKAQVEGADGNMVYATGKDPIETNATNPTEHRCKTTTRSDKPAQVRTTRRNRDKDESCNGNEAFKDETTNGKEAKETEVEPNDIFDPTSADHLSGEDRTSRQRNKVDKNNKEPVRTKASTQALEPDLAKDTGDIMVNAADEAPIPIDLANRTEGEDKSTAENISKDDKHVEVESQPTVATTSCLMNQPFIINIFYINENNINQTGSGISMNCAGGNSTFHDFNPHLSNFSSEPLRPPADATGHVSGK